MSALTFENIKQKESLSNSPTFGRRKESMSNNWQHDKAHEILNSSEGYDFGKINIKNNSSKKENCPLTNAQSFCPYGGACHTCPIRLQTKLAISKPNDEYEREAEDISEKIIQMPDLEVKHGGLTKNNVKAVSAERAICNFKISKQKSYEDVPWIQRQAKTSPMQNKKIPVPQWEQLPTEAKKELASKGYNKSWFDANTNDNLKRLTILNLYVKLKGLELWKYIGSEVDSNVGVLQFISRDIYGLKKRLKSRSDFTNPEESINEWSSREKRASGSLHFKHFKEWPINKVQAHIDQTGLLLKSHAWWLLLPVPLIQMARHGIEYLGYDDYKEVFGIREMLLRQGWWAEPLVGINSNIQRKARSTVNENNFNYETPSIINEVLKSPGQPLDNKTRAFMEPRFGRDFSKIRIHKDSKSTESAKVVNALAYTVGQDIVFGSGQFAPGTSQGNRLIAHELVHVLQERRIAKLRYSDLSIVRLQRGKPEFEKAAKGKKGPTREYEFRCRGFLVTKYSYKGIEFLVSVHESSISTIEGNLDSIVAAITEGNSFILDPKFQVRSCIIAHGVVTRFSTYYGKPVLALDPSRANRETAIHEMGHAIFDWYISTSGKSKSVMKDIGLIISDIYIRLSDSKSIRDYERDISGLKEQKEHKAGLWIADPSQWSKNLPTEHPWDDADELFASARRAYLLDKRGFKRSIDKFSKLDPKVKAPANDLLSFISLVERRKVPRASKVASQKAIEHLGSIDPVGKLESVLGFKRTQFPLRWAVDPRTMAEDCS